MPVTAPKLLTLATDVFRLVQVPPLVALLNVVVNPSHTVSTPVMVVSTVAFTLTDFVADVLPQPLVTV
jgi:hypothetical protein